MTRSLLRSLARRLGATAVALGTLGAAPAVAELRGVVIGINNYAQLENLDGAVNDARDVADALRTAGATDVQLLLDRAVTRDAVMRAWNEAIARSAPGDILVFHYAGHGGQSPERVKGSEATGMDSELLLAGFTAEAPGNYERIVDDEIHIMLKRATDAGLAVLLATDSCHSGTMTRGFDTRLPRPKVRAAAHGPITDDRLPPANREAAFAHLEDLPNVVSLGAVQDDELAPEVILDGQPRGALSWSLARGLRGNADLDKDGVITDDELQTFVRDSVRVVMEGQQHPSIHRTRNAAKLLIGSAAAVSTLAGTVLKEGSKAMAKGAAEGFAKGLGEQVAKEIFKEEPPVLMSPLAPLIAQTSQGGASAGATLQGLGTSTTAMLPTLSMRLINVEPASLKAWAGTLNADGFTLIDGDRADLVWDVARGEVLNGLGDLVAYVGKNRPSRGGASVSATRAFARVGQPTVTSTPPPVQPVTLETASEDWQRVRGVIDKWRLVAELRDRGITSGLQVTLSPGDRYYRKGDKATVTVTGMRHSYFALLNLTSEGTIEILYPQPGEHPAIPRGQFTLPLVVQPPYGADHFIALSADTPLKTVLEGLRQAGRNASSRQFARLVADHLDGLPHQQIGLHAVYTAPWAQ